MKQPVSIEVGYERLGPECSDQPNLLMESAQGQYQLVNGESQSVGRRYLSLCGVSLDP